LSYRPWRDTVAPRRVRTQLGILARLWPRKMMTPST